MIIVVVCCKQLQLLANKSMKNDS